MFLRDYKSLYSMRADCKSARTGMGIRTNEDGNSHEQGWESARTGLTDDAAGGVDCCIMMLQLHGHDAAIALSCISNDSPAGFWAEGCAGGGGTLLGFGRRGVPEAVEPCWVWTDGLLSVG